MITLLVLLASSSFAIDKTTTLHSPGTVDSSFGTGGFITIPSTEKRAFYAMGLQSDGKLLAISGPGDWSVHSLKSKLTRYNSDGSVDLSFGNSGSSVLPFTPYFDFWHTWLNVIVQSDGKILVAGTIENDDARGVPLNYSFVSSRFNYNGSPDVSYGKNGIVYGDVTANPSFWKLELQKNMKLVALGYFGDDGDILVRYNQDGSVDSSFGGNGFLKLKPEVLYPESALAITIQADGKILVAFDGNKLSERNVFRYNIDGAVDQSFGTNGKLVVDVFGDSNSYWPGLSADRGTPILLSTQPDGKILIGGSMDEHSLPGHIALGRYNANGTIDSAFGQNGLVLSSFNPLMGNSPKSIVEQADGTILVAGDGFGHLGLARFKGNGSPDMNFGTNGVFSYLGLSLGEDNGVQQTQIQSDRKILIMNWLAIGKFFQ